MTIIENASRGGAPGGPALAARAGPTLHVSEWRFPLELLPAEREPLTERQAARWVWFFLALGIVARTARYLLRFPLWEDEAFLSANLLDRGYAELMGPLDYDQVCPLGFLWVQLSLVKLLGFHEFSLRLFSYVAGVAGLFLFRHLAGRFLKGSPLVVAVAIFAVAYPGIRYAAEAKPYGADLFFSLLLAAMAVAWWRRPLQRRWLWGLTGLVPVAVGISFTAVFVGGGISLWAAWLLWRRRDRGGWGPWIAYNVALVGSFGLLFALSAGSQSSAILAWMQNYWQEGFPPLTHPLKLAKWLVVTHSGDLLAYPFGGRRGGSTLTLLCCVAGIVSLCRRRQYPFLLFWLAPLGLTFVAAALHRYPYGQMVKFQIYMAPAFCMLAGAGAAVSVLREKRGRSSFPTTKKSCVPFFPLTILLGALALFGIATMARDFWFPAKSAWVMRARDFARWFWVTAQFDGEVACLKTDLDLCFAPNDYQRGLSSMYRCNQRIYSPRHARGEPPQWDRVSDAWPLRCVEYRSMWRPYDQAAHDRWLAEMQARYEMVGRERYLFAREERKGRPSQEPDCLEVYKFVPRSLMTGPTK